MDSSVDSKCTTVTLLPETMTSKMMGLPPELKGLFLDLIMFNAMRGDATYDTFHRFTGIDKRLYTRLLDELMQFEGNLIINHEDGSFRARWAGFTINSAKGGMEMSRSDFVQMVNESKA